MFNYSDISIDQLERAYSPDCYLPFFQHPAPNPQTPFNLYKVSESFLPGAESCLSYWVAVVPNDRIAQCSCSWHRSTDWLCQHIATVLLYKWFELCPRSNFNTATIDSNRPTTQFQADRETRDARKGENEELPLVVRQSYDIAFLHFYFEPAVHQALLELRSRYRSSVPSELD